MRLLGAGLLVAACAAPRVPNGVVWTEDAMVLARTYALVCPSGSRIQETSTHPKYAERACMRDGVREGPWTKVFAARGVQEAYENLEVFAGSYAKGLPDGTHSNLLIHVDSKGVRTGKLEYTFWENGETRGVENWELERGTWSKQNGHRVDRRGVLIQVYNARYGTVLQGDMPGGTGRFTITDASGNVRAEGECRDGRRHGTWVEREGQTVTRLRTYRAGVFEGPQSWRGEEGEVRNGRHVGIWTARRESVCVDHGPTSGCGISSCTRWSAPAVVRVRFDKNDKAEVLDVTWDATSKGEHVAVEWIGIPGGTLPVDKQSCRDLIEARDGQLP